MAPKPTKKPRKPPTKKPRAVLIDADLGLMREAELLRLVAVGKTSLDRWIDEGKFPEPIKIGPRSVAWRVGDVRRWLEALGPSTVDEGR
jgi:prophage regulatory protein